MARKSVLITGASGLLGRQVVLAFQESGWQVTGTAFSRANGGSLIKVDLENVAEMEKALDSVKPDVVVHCAANRFPDKVDKDPEGTRRLNIEASRSLAQLCSERGVVLIYLSTDYVFSGKPGDAPYESDASPAPPNFYGQSKLDGERAVLDVYGAKTKASPAAKAGGRAVVLRVPVLYGAAETPAESAVNVLMEAVKKVQQPGIAMDMDDWSIRYPTNTADVARVLKDIARVYVEAETNTPLPSVLQFTGEQRFTKYEICQLFAEILGVGIGGMRPEKTGGTGPVQRPFDCHMSTRALKELGISVHTQDFSAWWRREAKAFRH